MYADDLLIVAPLGFLSGYRIFIAIIARPSISPPSSRCRCERILATGTQPRTPTAACSELGVAGWCSLSSKHAAGTDIRHSACGRALSYLSASIAHPHRLRHCGHSVLYDSTQLATRRTGLPSASTLGSTSQVRFLSSNPSHFSCTLCVPFLPLFTTYMYVHLFPAS